MNARSRYILSGLAVGTLSVTILTLLGFWARWICVDALTSLSNEASRDVMISPIGLLSEEVDEESEVVAPSLASLTRRKTSPSPHVVGLGSYEYFDPWLFDPDAGRTGLIFWDRKPRGKRFHFDKGQGLFVFSRLEKQPNDEGKEVPQRIWLYAGTDGMAETPERTLGRFRSPVVSVWGDGLIVYDVHQRHFYRVDFEQEQVIRGPQLNPDEGRQPVQIGEIRKHANLFTLRIEPPRRKADPNDSGPRPHGSRYVAGRLLYPDPPVATSPWPSPYAFVLDASGRIDLLDKETLAIVGSAGTLPAVPERSGRRRKPAKHESLIAYKVRPVLTPEDDALAQWEYRGLVVAAYNYDGSFLSLAAFDNQGRRVAVEGKRTIVSASVPGGLMVSTARFLLENLHPPVLSLLSYFTAPYWPAGSGNRALFVLPDSSVATKGCDVHRLSVLRFIDALVMMLPALAFVYVLAILVVRDAQRIGFSKDTRTLWVLITIAFGLPAFVTYRLTRPSATLVTCANCGLHRRPDLERCHRCNSLWHVPELDPPTWRVLDGGRLKIDESPPKVAEDTTD